jgi:cell wall-associated NlpC family hydrolase
VPCVEAPKVRRNWLAKAAIASVALSVPAVGLAGSAQAATVGASSQQKTVAQQKVLKKVHKKPYKGKHRRPESFDQRAATYVKTMEGAPYAYGGTSPAGFDCSGLTQYVYRHLGKRIGRTAEDQFLESRRLSKSRAWGGDLVFFHESSDPNSYVYHVGVYEGRDDMVAATTYGEGVQWQNFSWAGDTVTFGTVSH